MPAIHVNHTFTVWSGDGRRVIAAAEVDYRNMEENKHLGQIEINVLPTYRRQGFGRRMLALIAECDGPFKQALDRSGGFRLVNSFGCCVAGGFSGGNAGFIEDLYEQYLVDADSAPFGDFDEVHVAGVVEGEWPQRARRRVRRAYPAIPAARCAVHP